MKLFTARELVEFYEKIDNGEEALFRGRTTNASPNLICDADLWSTRKAIKKIDLAPFIGSNVLMLFKDEDGNLASVSALNEYANHKMCIPLYNQKFVPVVGHCNVPEGYIIRYGLLDGLVMSDVTPTDVSSWEYIRWFEILGIKEGYSL